MRSAAQPVQSRARTRAVGWRRGVIVAPRPCDVAPDEAPKKRISRLCASGGASWPRRPPCSPATDCEKKAGGALECFAPPIIDL